MMKKALFLLLLLLILGTTSLFAGFTIKRTIIVEETGFSSQNDPVEALENAVQNAKRSGAGMIEGQIKGGTTTVDGILSSDWVEKKANIQVYDVKILEKTFVSPGEVKVKIRLIAGYLDLPKFWTEYDKTIKGAAYRTMVIPGLGQVYNGEYFSAGLYSIFYWTFYLAYINQMDNAKNNEQENIAFVSFQLPAMVFWTLAVSDASISRLMLKFGLEQIKDSYRAQALPMIDRYVITFEVLKYRF